jgi:hypothetical protein
MDLRPIVLMLGVVALAGCASEPERDWMKVNQNYTVQEFRRDIAECSPRGKLDDACMHSRGWVDVNRPNEKAPDLRDKGGGYRR